MPKIGIVFGSDPGWFASETERAGVDFTRLLKEIIKKAGKENE